MGTVESIGMKTTRLRSLSGEQLVFGNSDLVSSRIQNFGRLDERRANFIVGVTYDTKPDQMREVVQRIRTMLKEHPAIDQEFFLNNRRFGSDITVVFDGADVVGRVHAERPEALDGEARGGTTRRGRGCPPPGGRPGFVERGSWRLRGRVRPRTAGPHLGRARPRAVPPRRLPGR